GDTLVDCDDPDCFGVLGACDTELNCTDGEDNDADSLMDCEDADCSADPICVEVCDNTTDDDGDGFADCEDDDCWGPACSMTGTRAWVTGGSVQIDELTAAPDSVFTSFQDPACDASDAITFGTPARRMTARNVTGQVQVSRMASGSLVTETCSWTATEVGGFDVAGTGQVTVNRQGFTLTDAERCRLAGSSFLPALLSVVQNAAQLPGGGTSTGGNVSWYGGNFQASTTGAATLSTSVQVDDSCAVLLLAPVNSAQRSYDNLNDMEPVFGVDP
ncbi:MAG: hypothetical protein ACJATT_004399, partial [Myxococcota bacterium]